MEVVQLIEEVERLRRALSEERKARRFEVASLWAAIEDLQEEVRRRAVREPAGREAAVVGPVESQSLSTGEAGRTVTPSVRDVAAQTEPSQQSSLTHLHRLKNEQLKCVLEYLDCRQLLRSRQVCKRWRAAIDGMLDECRTAHAGDLHGYAVPASDTHMFLIAHNNPDMTMLQGPERGRLDLGVVANTCRNLEEADLRGFSCGAESLEKLARQNSGLWSVTLPAGCREEELEALLRHTTNLVRLTVDSPDGTGRWLQLLPQSLERLDLSGLEAPLEQWLPQAGLASLRGLYLRGCSGVTDRTLASLPGLTPGLGLLCIGDCPGVTAGGLRQLSRLTKLCILQLHGVPGGVTAGMLDSLHGCSELQWLCLGDPERPPETAIPAAAVSRLAVACRKLFKLFVHTTADQSQAVLTDLKNTDLGRDSDGRPRTVRLYVPDPVYSQLRRPPAGSRITLHQWVISDN